jgi:uncharacterized membrane protein YiaA
LIGGEGKRPGGLITAGRVIWLIALALFAAWLVGVLAGKGGFIHILILCAVSVAFVQWMADRRASQG